MTKHNLMEIFITILVVILLIFGLLASLLLLSISSLMFYLFILNNYIWDAFLCVPFMLLMIFFCCSFIKIIWECFNE